MATIEPISTPPAYWRLVHARYNNNRCYYHEGRNELAWEDPQDGRLIALPPAAEEVLRETLGLAPTLEQGTRELKATITQLQRAQEQMAQDIAALRRALLETHTRVQAVESNLAI